MYSEKLITIVIVNYNGFSDTVECIKSLKKINYKNYKIIIVDNCSTDDSFNLIKKFLDEKCILIKSTVNRGFSYGNNLGIKKSLEMNADYILLLNNDTVVESNFVNEMIRTFNLQKNIGIVCCKILYYDNKEKIWFGGGNINWNKFRGVHQQYKNINNNDDIIREITFATGCCMMIKKETIKKIGLLPEEYFMYFEDVDYCIKTQLSGYKIMYNPKAVIYHKVSSSTGGEESNFYIKWATRNRILVAYKYRNCIKKVQFLKGFSFIFISRFIKYIYYLCTIKLDKAKSLRMGLIDGVKNLNCSKDQ